MKNRYGSILYFALNEDLNEDINASFEELILCFQNSIYRVYKKVYKTEIALYFTQRMK